MEQFSHAEASSESEYLSELVFRCFNDMNNEQSDISADLLIFNSLLQQHCSFSLRLIQISASGKSKARHGQTVKQDPHVFSCQDVSQGSSLSPESTITCSAFQQGPESLMQRRGQHILGQSSVQLAGNQCLVRAAVREGEQLQSGAGETAF